jgi:hypothetical protein
MATIKTQGGKVILKNGKVSCECCGGGAPECNPNLILNQYNTIQISEEKYIQIYNGGTWSISTNFTEKVIIVRPGSTVTCDSDGSGSGSFFSSGCDAQAFGIIGSGSYNQVTVPAFGSTFTQTGTTEVSYALSYSLIRKKETIDNVDSFIYSIRYNISFTGSRPFQRPNLISTTNYRITYPPELGYFKAGTANINSNQLDIYSEAFIIGNTDYTSSASFSASFSPN